MKTMPRGAAGGLTGLRERRKRRGSQEVSDRAKARIEDGVSRRVVRTKRIRSVDMAEQHKLLLVRRSCYITSSECSGDDRREMFWKSRGRS